MDQEINPFWLCQKADSVWDDDWMSAGYDSWNLFLLSDSLYVE